MNEKKPGDTVDVHPNPQTLKSFLLGRLSPEKRREVIRHLVHGCNLCRQEMAPWTKAVFNPGSLGSDPVLQGPGRSYDNVLASACAWTLKKWQDLEKERSEAEAKLARLLYRPKGKKVELVEEPGFWTLALCETLLEKSWQLRHEDPAGMLHLAQLATEAAQRLEAADYGEEHLADLQARAWAALANALRISDQLSLAQQVFTRAFDALRRGSGAPLLRARIAELAASLMCDLRQFPTAFQLLDVSFRLYRRQGSNHEAGKALVTKGLHTGYTGDPEEGVRLLASGLRLIDRDREPKLPFHILHNILLFRIELGQFRVARRQLWEMRPLYQRHADRINLIKLRGLEGRIYVGLGDFERATRAFLQVKESFTQEGMAYDAALISFDLAAVWLREGKRKEVRQLIHEMLETFRARYIAREAIGALLMLREAADRGEITVSLLDMVATLFRSLKDGPKAADPGETH